MENSEKAKNRIKNKVLSKLRMNFGKDLEDATKSQIYKACALTVRDSIMEKWTEYEDYEENAGSKQLYYLSVEFLMGRALGNNLINLLKDDLYREVFESLGIDLTDIEEIEPDAGLGNGGLGRLAACFLDSLSTLQLPATGCGIRYEYGLFKQKITDGYQTELPDPWLENGSIWEIPRPEEQEEVKFGGRIEQTWENGRSHIEHKGYNSVIAVPYDMPITGYDSPVVNTLKLWSAKAPKDIDMKLFGEGDYIRAAGEKELAETISKILYPEDTHYEGKALRLKQHYFFVSATMQHIVKKHKERYELWQLPDKVTIHINDTHPAIAIPELMRILLDEENMDWEDAWDITTSVFAYTNHTVLSEALEKWPLQMFKELLPRIFMIVSEMNERQAKKLWDTYPGNWELISTLSIIAYGQVRMANMSIIGSKTVNGVSNLHTEILKKDTFKDFYNIYPNKFIAITNGVTHRRWLMHANPKLSSLIRESIGDGWIKDSCQLKNLESFVDDSAFKEKFSKIKQENKNFLANYIKEVNGIDVDPNSIFDVQVKRLHEYKRQLLNILHIMYLYNRLLNNPDEDIYPRTFLFGAKASPGYHRAKLIIKLINSLADKINNDKSIKGKIKVAFLEDYRVSLAEKIFPAANVSEQISTAGKEASGTGNMKFMLNGALTIGTLDGANIEMRQQVGAENIFIFGMKAARIEKYYKYGGYNPRDIYEQNFAIKKVVDQLINGFVQPDSTRLFTDIYHSLLYGDNGSMADQYFVLGDFESYCHVQEQIDVRYRNQNVWTKKSIINVARSGYFSSDRAIEEYNDKIWKLKAIEI